MDVLPKSVKLSRVKQWLTEQVQSVGLRPVDVMLVSGKKATSIDDLLETIEEHRDGRDVYVVGVTNVGKSTVMNQIIRAATGNKEDVITTSQFPAQRWIRSVFLWTMGISSSIRGDHPSSSDGACAEPERIEARSAATRNQTDHLSIEPGTDTVLGRRIAL